MKITTGILGWGNRKNGLEAYGPQGRWFKRASATKSEDVGDLLGDHLESVGLHEGSRLIVIGMNRFDLTPDREELLLTLIESTVRMFEDERKQT